MINKIIMQDDAIYKKWCNYIEVVEDIKSKKNILIICHKKPDGDTIGSAYALGLALIQLGSRIKICCEDEFPNKYEYMTKLIKNVSFENPDYVIAVDVADINLIGQEIDSLYGNKIDLCIDHHVSHKNFSKCDIVFSESAANCENIYELIKFIGVDVKKEMADCLYTGIVTDTGSFQYINTNAKSHMIAAELMNIGADYRYINKIAFRTKTLSRLKFESFIVDNVEFFFDGKCSVNVLTYKDIHESGYSEEDMAGAANISKNIEGVLIGIVMKEEEKDIFKISIRTDGYPNAQKICGLFDGGGHIGAAGCTISGTADYAKKSILLEVKKYFC